jgi:hypothetical protein
MPARTPVATLTMKAKPSVRQSSRVGQGDVRRGQARNEVDDPRGEQQPRESAEHGKQYGLDHQLPDDARPAGAERKADGNLLLPAGPARQQQVRDVGAGDQQHETGGRDEHARRGPDLADDLLAKAGEPRVMIGIVARHVAGELC